MKNFGTKLAAALAIGLALPLFITAGLLDGTGAVCNAKWAWVIGTGLFTVAESRLILGADGLKNPLMKANKKGETSGFATWKLIAIAAAIYTALQYWVVSEC